MSVLAAASLHASSVLKKAGSPSQTAAAGPGAASGVDDARQLQRAAAHLHHPRLPGDSLCGPP